MGSFDKSHCRVESSFAYCVSRIASTFLSGMVRGLLKNQPKWSGNIFDIYVITAGLIYSEMLIAV